jgi:murein DD-endopeptidase MepM/ murein hydrolase activator NlpD
MSTTSRQIRVRPWVVGLVILLAVLAAVLHLQTRQIERANASPYPVARAPGFAAELVELPAWRDRVDSALDLRELPLEVGFRRGETLGGVLGDLGLQPAAAQQMIEELASHIDVRRLRPQDRYAALTDDDGELRALHIVVDGKGKAVATRTGDGWQSTWSDFTEVAEVEVVRGVLEGSLEASIRRAGGESVVAYVMADVLQWDLDFNRDLRVGDRFAVLYEKIFLDGEFHRIGEVLALRYGNQDRMLEAYQFGVDRGHYDGDGRPLQKLFLRSPLRYSRVTSGFSSRRFHPVLKSYRPHYGVDYGAPVGTPVRVTGNGVVRFAGWDRGGGKTVKVRHPNGYLTAYLHLSRFADGVRAGARVAQGEVIGYVGSTGLSTGPHLDYRMQKGGRWINPQAFKSEPAPPIPEDLLSAFMAARDSYREALETGRLSTEPTVTEGQRIAELESLDQRGESTDVH